MPKQFTDAQLDELIAKGYLIVPGLLFRRAACGDASRPTPCTADMGRS